MSCPLSQGATSARDHGRTLTTARWYKDEPCLSVSKRALWCVENGVGTSLWDALMFDKVVMVVCERGENKPPRLLTPA